MTTEPPGATTTVKSGQCHMRKIFSTFIMYHSIFVGICAAVADQLINRIGLIQYLATLILLFGYKQIYNMCL